MRRILGLWRWALVVSAFAGCGAPMPVIGDSGTVRADSGPTCQPTQAVCGGACVNVQSDNANCGGCGVVCSGQTSCRAGVCDVSVQTGCFGSRTECGGVCVLTDSDRTHCGGCGIRCGADQSCRGGACADTCAPSQQLCSGVCANVLSDNANCGRCGAACTGGTSCVDGQCRAPAARCGDGTCNVSESCQSCPADCSAQCGTQCIACATNTDCPTGSFCGVRRCDGVRGCYPTADPNAGCDRVGTERCPAVAAYNTCASDPECGTYASCSAFADGRRICSRRCSADGDCPSPPPGSAGVSQRCDIRSQRCFLECSGPGTCPFGLSCFRYDTGTYGYCS